MPGPRLALFVSTALLACGSSETPPDTTAAGKADDPAPAKAASDEAKAPAAAGAASDAKAESPPKTVEAAPTDEWVVWFSRADGEWVTRWVADEGDTTKTLAERKALVHASGDRLHVITRHDAIVEIQTCACLGEEFAGEEACEKTGTVTQPGLRATDLLSRVTFDLVSPPTDAVLGEVYAISLEVTGGVNGKLVVRSADAGYYCGAHQSIAGGDAIVDLEHPDKREWPTLTLPREVRMAAATGEMFDLYKDCGEGPDSIDDFVDSTIGWSGLAIALVDGKPEITWGFSADVYYACSPDYLASGTTQTGLLPEAASLGLGGPVPAGLQRAFDEIGTARVVGWSKLALPPSRRKDALDKFAAVDETAWPPAESVVTEAAKTAVAAPETGTGATTVDTATAKAKLAEGRKLTRAKDYAGAIAAFDAAIAADPNMQWAWGGRGYAKLLDDQLAEAKKDCTHALTLDDEPRFAAAVHYNLGLIAKKQGDDKAARKAFTESLKLRPNSEVQKALDEL